MTKRILPILALLLLFPWQVQAALTDVPLKYEWTIVFNEHLKESEAEKVHMLTSDGKTEIPLKKRVEGNVIYVQPLNYLKPYTFYQLKVLGVTNDHQRMDPYSVTHFFVTGDMYTTSPEKPEEPKEPETPEESPIRPPVEEKPPVEPEETPDVSKLYGDRMVDSHHGFHWYYFDQKWDQFVMTGINHDQEIVGGVSKTPTESFKYPIRIGQTRELTQLNMGKRAKKMLVSNYYTDYYDMYYDGLADRYIYLFYDAEESFRLRTIMWIDANTHRDYPKLVTSKEQNHLLYTLTQVERVNRGLRPYEYDEKLEEIAQAHSEDMAEHEFFGHVSSDGRKVEERYAKAKLPTSTLRENVGMNEFGTLFAHEMLMNSSGHRASKLAENVTHIGVGTVARINNKVGGLPLMYVTENYIRYEEE